MRPLTMIEKEELRSMTETLVSHGYEERDAKGLLWKGYCGGMDGARAVFRNLEDIPSIGETEIEF